ncbi:MULTISPECIES: DNA starvation/stationary phase protection protein [unclassified Streptomyces]|uniref:Dps family protein n=1 Tax=unclassified Streptomyces TaxID=2593676 RepID=UPI002E81D4B3|nr:DNA starvation/stationary phase protection protein [Streptomyces sp. NBC_00562]WTC76965.1 DNA starvation/stationary phase protection protein [Streptomyces sp. NBC_01653]WTD93895.1 DNA starvation/stationary phase protection protein [Streptomyces sp. NBC_01637]WUC24917.1 DNA starvation/stationary phase protection protein [Streptomyces sp. NBC_00562]
MSPSDTTPRYSVPGLGVRQGGRAIELLQPRLHALNDLALTLKHIHWNVVGPNFIAVHEMLDPQTAAVRSMADGTAERISALGGEPHGTPGALVSERTWDDYSIGRADALAHLGALDLVYSGVIKDHRSAAAKVASIDPVTEDLLIGHLRSLEQFQWFIRAHLENSNGTLIQAGASSEAAAAEATTPVRKTTSKKTTGTKRAAKKATSAKRTR